MLIDSISQEQCEWQLIKLYPLLKINQGRDNAVNHNWSKRH